MLEGILTPDLFAAALRMATPLALAAIGGTLCERAGVVNIALEGMMLAGAFGGTAATLALGDPWLGVAAAVVSGGLLAALHGLASITLRADQVVSGTAINILALGLTGFLMEALYGHPGTTEAVRTLPQFLPAAGEGASGPARWVAGILLGHTPLVYGTILVAAGAHWALFRTAWGLRLRAMGEHPRAAETAGVDVVRGRWGAVLLSGALAGLAGANLALEQVGSFTEGMTSGRGFIALAANIFGRWTPVGSWLASLLFGFADALQIKMQILRGILDVSPQFFLMLPYGLTVVVLAGAMGRAIAPAALGRPHERR